MARCKKSKKDCESCEDSDFLTSCSSSSSDCCSSSSSSSDCRSSSSSSSSCSSSSSSSDCCEVRRCDPCGRRPYYHRFNRDNFEEDADYRRWRQCSYGPYQEYRKYCDWSDHCARNNFQVDDFDKYEAWERSQRGDYNSDFQSYKLSAPSYADYSHWNEYRSWCQARHACCGKNKKVKPCVRKSNPRYCVAYALYRYYKKHCSKRSYQIYKCFRLFQKWLAEKECYEDYDYDYDYDYERDHRRHRLGCDACQHDKKKKRYHKKEKKYHYKKKGKCCKKEKDCGCCKEKKIKCCEFKKWMKHCADKCEDFLCDYEAWKCEKSDCDFAVWLKFYKCYKKELRKPLYQNCGNCCECSTSAVDSTSEETDDSSEEDQLFPCHSWVKNSLYFYLKRYISCKLYKAYKRYVLFTRQTAYPDYCDYIDNTDSDEFDVSKKELKNWRKCYSEEDYNALFAFFCWLKNRKDCDSCCDSSSSSSSSCSSSSSSDCSSSSSSSSCGCH